MLLDKGANTKMIDRSGRDALACAKKCHIAEKIDEICNLILAARKAENAPDRRIGELQYKQRGNEAFKRNDFKTAVAEYSRALEINQLSAVLWANRAAAHLELKNFEAAYKDARMSKSLDKAYLKAHYRLAQALYGLGSLFGAKNACIDALEISPTDPTILALFADINKKLAEFARSSGDPDLPASQNFTTKSDEIYCTHADQRNDVKVWMTLKSSDKADYAGERNPLACIVMIRNLGKNTVKLEEPSTYNWSMIAVLELEHGPNNDLLNVAIAEWELHTLHGSIFRPNFEDGELKRRRTEEKKRDLAKQLAGVSFSEINFHRTEMVDKNGISLKKDERSVTLGKGDSVLTWAYFPVPGCDYAAEAVKKTRFVRVKLLVNGQPVTYDLTVDQAKVKKFYAGFRPGLLGTYDKVAPQKWYYTSTWTAEEDVEHDYRRDEENKNKLSLGHIEDSKYPASVIRNWFQFDKFPTSLAGLKLELTAQAERMSRHKVGHYGWACRLRKEKGLSLKARDLFFVDEDEETGERSLRPIVSDDQVRMLKEGDRIHIRWEDDKN